MYSTDTAACSEEGYVISPTVVLVSPTRSDPTRPSRVFFISCCSPRSLARSHSKTLYTSRGPNILYMMRGPFTFTPEVARRLIVAGNRHNVMGSI